jgi:LPXTG-motif cell wall-anchored protein
MFRLSIALVLAALALPAAAAAKGPSEGTISGPGFAKTVKVLYDGGGGSPGDNLSQASGFFPAAFGQSPDPMLPGKPSGRLGPRYTVVWTVPGNGAAPIRQELYPYARGGSVSYTKPGQRIFGMATHRGWYRDTALKRTMVALGLPAKAPSSSTGPSTWLIAGLAGALALAAVALLARRRQRGQRSPSTSSTELPAGSRT